MKVLFVQDTYFYKGNNNQYYSEHIDNCILNRYLHLGDKVTFLGREENQKKHQDLKKRFSPLDKSKCSVVGVPNFKTLKGYFKYKKKVQEKVENTVKEHDIIMPRIPSALGALAVKYAIKHNKALIGEIVGCTWDGYWNYNLKGKLVASYYYFKQRKIVKKLPYAVYVTQHFLQKRYPTRGKHINASNVVIQNVDHSILEKRLHKILNKKEDEVVVFATIAGLDVPFKGQKYVLQAMAKSKIKNSVYKVVGNGSGNLLKENAKSLNLVNKFEVIGAIKHNEIFDFLDDIDLYIQPSKQEGLPRALIEAMSRGLPSIGSRTGGIPELLDREFIFNKGDSRELAKIIDKYDKDKMFREAKRNFNKAQEYSIANLNNKRYRFYYEFLRANDLPIPDKLNKVIHQ